MRNQRSTKHCSALSLCRDWSRIPHRDLQTAYLSKHLPSSLNCLICAWERTQHKLKLLLPSHPLPPYQNCFASLTCTFPKRSSRPHVLSVNRSSLPPLTLSLWPRCSRPARRRTPGRVGWRSTPLQQIRVSPRWSPVPLTSTNPTDTVESTSRHAALPRSHATGNCHWTTLCCSCFMNVLAVLLLNAWRMLQICPGYCWQWSLCFPHGCVRLLPALSSHQPLLGLLPSDSLGGRAHSLGACERDMCPQQ